MVKLLETRQTVNSSFKHMLTSINRIIKFAFKDFLRNKGISIAAIFVLTIMVLLVTTLYFVGGISAYLASEIQNKIDITAYFNSDADEEAILNVREEILKMSPGIKSIEYVSRDQALISFNEKHKDNPALAKALQEVGENPFLPSLNIITSGDPAQYEQVATVLETSSFAKILDKVDFSQKRDTIEKVYSINKNIRNFGIILGIILATVAVLVVFNTIKLVIENSKDEIATMRIVGASNVFIRGPFIIQGVIYGLFAFIISILVSAIASLGLSPKLSLVLPGFSVFDFFLTNLVFLILIQLGFGVAVGAVSAYFVVRKYLKV